MKTTLHRRYWSLVAAVSTLLVIGTAVSCSDLPGTETTAGGDTTIVGDTTTLGVGDTTTEAVTTTTLVPSTTLAPTTTLLPATTTTTEHLSTSEERLPSGHIKALGFIKDVWVDASGRHLKIDYVDIISGEAAATAAAIEDGVILPGETWDAEFYVNNDNPFIRPFSISNSVEIYTQFRDHMVNLDGEPCTWNDFLSFWAPGPLLEGDSHLPDSLWWIERDGNTVVWTMQMFTP